MELICKNALVAEIEKRLRECMQHTFNQFRGGQINAFNGVLKILKTLEVKDVDLEKEVANWWNDHYKNLKDDYKFEKYNGHYMDNSTIISLAKHFFWLGLRASANEDLVGEIYAHIDSIKNTADRMTSGNFTHHRASIKFSADTIAKALELIGLKAQKEK